MDDRGEQLVDAERFLEFAHRLRGLRDRVEAAEVPPSRRTVWHERLIAIADEAQADLEGARAHVERFEAELDRHA